MFDESCGEIYGQAIFGPTQPDVVHRDFASVVEDCKARGVTRIAPVCVGNKPHWGETLQDGRQRFNEAFLAYVHRGTEKTRNFLVVTHADCVAAAATLLPGARDISKVHPGAVLMAQRFRPIGPGDGWSMMSSERSDEKRTEKIVLKSLSRAQGWQVDSSNIDFCTTQRSKESVMKRMVSSISGWSWAARECGQDVLLIIEKDRAAAAACAHAHQCEVIDVSTLLERALEGSIKSTTVVEACVSDLKVWMAFGILNVAHVMSSPPCQPWSGAGSGSGLLSDDGTIFSTVLKRSGQLHIMSLMTENVPGIVKHEDYPRLMAGATLDGMRVVVSGVHSCQRILPMYRDRWLATFCHASICTDASVVQTALGLSLADEVFNCPLPGPSLASADAVHPACAFDGRSHLVPSAEVLSMLAKSEFVPKWMSTKVDWTVSNPVLRARSITRDMKLSGIMARYGSQHLLPVEHLKSKGLQTMLFDENGLLRYFSPWEFLAALCFPPGVVLSSDLTEAYQQAGNAISPVHAWIQIVKTHVLLGHLSFFPCDFSPAETLRRIVEKGIKLSAFVPVSRGVFSALEPALEVVEDFPVNKRARVDDAPKAHVPVVTPTIAFAVEEPGCPSSTAALDNMPKFAIDRIESSAMNSFCSGGIMFLRHVQNNWMMIVHGKVDEKLQVLVQRALPHAKSCHFVTFMWNGRNIEWSDAITCAPPANVVFKPDFFPVECMFDDGTKIMLKGDVTWTAHTVLAFLSMHMKCNIDSLRISYDGIMMKSCDFIAEFPKQTFAASFRTCLPGYVACFPVEDQVADSGMIPAHGGCIRFVTRHPAKKITRTCCVPKGSSFAAVIRALLPDVSASVSWTIHVGGVPVEPDAVINENSCFVVEWDCFKPLAPTQICVSSFALPVDSTQAQLRHIQSPPRWVKSPFKVKPQVLQLPEDAWLADIAASFVSHAQLDVNLTCHVGGKLVDPFLQVHEVPVDDVISFKIAPLLGGAKQKIQDAMKVRVARVLEKHGVAKDTSADRAASFLQKADCETLSKEEGSDDDDFWKAIKNEANRVHFRLVFRNEMQQAKRDNRQKPPAKPAKKVKQAPSHEGLLPMHPMSSLT
eukprot:s306_g21.t1